MGRLEILGRSMGVGVVTKRYPYEPIEVPEGFRGKPVIDGDKCVGCGACANVCPPNAIEIFDEGGYRIVRLYIGRCIFCGRCSDICPENAISLTREFELSTASTNDLYQEVRLSMVKCKECGRYFTTYRLLAKAMKEVPPEERESMLICPECKARISAHLTSFARW